MELARADVNAVLDNHLHPGALGELMVTTGRVVSFVDEIASEADS